MRKFIVVFLTLLALVLPASANANHGTYVTYPSTAGDWGTRWQGKTMCVEDHTPSNGLRVYVLPAVRDWNSNTDLAIWYKRDVNGCSAYSQKIIVVQGNWGKTGWVGIVVGWENIRWGRTAAGHYTWMYNGPLTIRLNTYYQNTPGGWDHIITHELGHSLGMGHVTWSCQSVMANCAAWPTQTLWRDRSYINYIYAQ